MSMSDYSYNLPLAFLIDAEVAVYINMADIKTDPGFSPTQVADIEKTIRERAAAGRLEEAIQNRDPIIVDNDLDDICVAHEVLENGFHGKFDSSAQSYCSEFTGEATYLDKDGQPTVKYLSFEDDYIACIPAAQESGPFHQAYASMDEFIDEIKALFDRTGIFPDDFDFGAHIVSIDGTYFA